MINSGFHVCGILFDVDNVGTYSIDGDIYMICIKLICQWIYIAKKFAAFIMTKLLLQLYKFIISERNIYVGEKHNTGFHCKLNYKFYRLFTNN